MVNQKRSVNAVGFGNQRIAFPFRRGIPVVGGSDLFRIGIFAPIQPDETPIAIPARGHDKDPLPVRLLDDLHSVTILELPRPSRREAVGHGIVLQILALAILVQRFRPGLERSHLAGIGDVGQQTLGSSCGCCRRWSRTGRRDWDRPKNPFRPEPRPGEHVRWANAEPVSPVRAPASLMVAGFAAASFFPLARVSDLPLTCLLPSRARIPSAVTRVAHLDDLPVPAIAAPLEIQRALVLDGPIGDLAVRVADVQPDVDVRIGPVELGDGSAQGDGFLAVVLGRDGVVRPAGA